jgi:prepilin-type N-terminal cleavage/methylation domain-containing protein
MMSEKRTGYRIQDVTPLSPPLIRGEVKGGIVHRASCIMNRAGFSLVELMITMVVFLIVIAAASGILTGMITQFKQQSKITETNIEGAIGLEMMRRDIEHAGYGLPWVIDAAVAYNEALAAEAAAFNDCNGTAPCNPPRAIVSGNNMTTYASPNNVFNGSDYLAIKAANVAMSATSQTWTRLRAGDIKRNGLSGENFANNDRVIVISPGTGGADSQTLVVSAGAWWTTYGATATFAPTDATETRFIYGIGPQPVPISNLRMPFNRADYYIWRGGTTTATDEVPDRCAFGTGILRKAIIAHADGDRTPLPLLDCVADMQVGFGVDTDATLDGVPNCYVNNLADAITVDAANIRSRVKEVRVYILAHEGQYDRDFTFTPQILTSSIRVGEPSGNLPGGICTAETVLGRNFDLALAGIPNWQNYRWKVYTLVVKPNNLR